jgi:hypothetical protein
LPTANAGSLRLLASMPTEKVANGDEVETPTRPSWLAPETINAEVLLPWFDTANDGWKEPISMASLAQGEEVAIPTKPPTDTLLAVDMLITGCAVVEVPMLQTLFMPFSTKFAVVVP